MMRSLNTQHSRIFRRFSSARCTARNTDAILSRQHIAVERARAYYADVWSQGRLLNLNTIMAEGHEQHDMVWQPNRVGLGRKNMKRGILAYRSAYPDLAFRVQDITYSEQTHSVFVAWTARGTNLGFIRDQPPTQEVAEFAGISHLIFDDNNQIKASFVYRQASVGEARYFLGDNHSGLGS
ncbi:hypothetical protein Vretimale_12340 [Volvox reticuliferus]|uniref:SnoaL-like domain-containing protein n=1 Tax=Volvox reticuliferus TaxID=1737510 RepID=A0A8J4FPZ4_9CHLO|nr:hypothetical protein Vretifemale_8949 [Volvox reticuliferus]GIM08259.1 hypothetical protein Vretimale_12340 [Volvox reticuliferus]